MSILKRIQLLFLVLFPVCLMGMERHSSSTWIQEARACQQYGSWTGLDKTGKPVFVEGEVISKNGKIISSEADLKELASLFADVMQVTFVNIHEVSKIGWIYSKCNEWVTGKNHRDRLYDAYIEKMSTQILQNSDDIYFIITVSDLSEGKKNLLGVVLFDIKKDFKHGTVELDLVSVKLEAQGRGLCTILASAIFKFLPQIKRVILDVLMNNKKAIEAYQYFGFTRYTGKYKHEYLASFIDPEYHYEYLTDSPKCQKLQAVAATFKDIKV